MLRRHLLRTISLARTRSPARITKGLPFMPDTELAGWVWVHAQMTLSASAARAIDKMAEEMAQEILNEPGVRQRLRAMALEAIENTWREWNASRPAREGGSED